MNTFIVVLVATLAVAQASYYAGPSAKILQGPSSKTTLVGPEGSVISAVAPGGQVITEEHPGVVAYGAPVGHAAYAAPVVSHAAYAAPVVQAHAVPYVSAHAGSYVSAHAVPIAHGYSGHEDVVVAGPSGTIATGHSALGISAVAHHAVPLAAHIVPESYAHEGQYVHDYSESLYDDGSYKSHHY